MSAVPYTSGEHELLVSHTKKGSRMIATTQRVIWFDKDDALTILPMQPISRVTRGKKAPSGKNIFSICGVPTKPVNGRFSPTSMIGMQWPTQFSRP
jgi:hypothetical protein